MKNLFAISISAFLLYSCTTIDSKENAELPTADTREVVILNAGKKWKSDSSTRENVQRLQTLSTDFANHEMAEYKALSGSLQDGLNKMIKACRMKGKEHEALHQWLEPFARSVKELNEATEVSQARKIFGQIQRDLEVYPQYFE